MRFNILDLFVYVFICFLNLRVKNEQILSSFIFRNSNFILNVGYITQSGKIVIPFSI